VGTAAFRLIVLLCLSLVPARRAPRSDGAGDLWQGNGELWARNDRVNLAYNFDFHGNCKNFLHAENVRTDGFTSPPKEGALRFFSKILRLRPGSNPRTWVPEASALTTRPPKPHRDFDLVKC
jgi:hypothetical protein